MNLKIVRAEAALERAKAKLLSVIEECQTSCKHSSVVEAPYEPASCYSSASAPFRVCADCGFMEDGWGCGYDALDVTSVKRISREEGYKMRKLA